MEPRTITFTLPSSRKITIREQNGADDEILSQLSDLKKGFGGWDKFIVAITVDPVLTLLDLGSWHTNDKYYTLLKSRIFSLGPNLHFGSECPSCSHKGIHDEDLSAYDWDLSKPILEVKPGPLAVKSYPLGLKTEVEFKLSSGKHIRYDIITVAHESYALLQNEHSLNKNSELLMRKIAYKEAGKDWMPILSFSNFSPKDMSEIRKNVSVNDPQWDLNSRIKCPNPMCEKVYNISLLSQPDFFFPLEIS